ncbi:hypothetical protein HID58_056520 [Brassica napus]|uniref:Uncharacterized protein n=3 Tax=Brassica TaxID=3705 RepID=A0ABQ8ANJ1_BRANA|nr:hypothetical protein F2Q68_00013821 [Brassica cretica]KAH0853263.1 hypothetical protein HID58_093386 [Brassica napus]KAH0894091.1 hypothetical protein HID58_056520 [Brassica napus]CDY41661.1 BnaC03g62230D [Brassica napus]
MVEIWKSKCRRACSRSVAKVFNPHRNFNTLLLHCFCFIDPETVGELAVYSWWSMLGSGEPKTSSTTVSGKSHGDSVVISNVEGKKRETRGLGCHSKWWLTAAELRSLKAAWFCY